MAFNTQEIISLFKAGIATVAVNSRTAAELSITQRIVTDIAHPRSMDVMLWDSGKMLQKVEPTKRGKTILGITKTPVQGFKVEGHPVAAILKHIEAECQGQMQGLEQGQALKPVLFVLKDLYPYIAGREANPALVRLAIDACFALKRSQNRLIILHDGLETPRVFLDLITDTRNPLPTEAEATDILTFRLNALQKSAESQNKTLEVTLSPSDTKRLVRALLGMTQEGMDDTVQLCATRLGRIDSRTIDVVSDIKKEQFASRGIEYAKAPDVKVQGLPVLSQWAHTQSALLEPEARELFNIPFPKGMLLVGVGGTGKTLGVKCIAQDWGLPVIVLDTGKLMTKELGGSEANLRQAIEAAEAMAPSILFIDEMDKMFPGQGSNETDGGTSQRMFGYFLQWFQESEAQVFVAATANRPWQFKPEILRRFTQIFYVDLPNRSARTEIFRVQLERFKLSLSASHIQQLAQATADFTGDEIRKLVQECAAQAYAQRRPGKVTVEELLAQINRKLPQFRGNTDELESLRKWARSGQALFASDDPLLTATALEGQRYVSWDEPTIVDFSQCDSLPESA